MANLIRSAKSGNDWTQNELRAYNIQVVEQSLSDFFNQNQLPPVPLAVRHFCQIVDRSLAQDDVTYKLMHHLDLAQNPKVGQVTAELSNAVMGGIFPASAVIVYRHTPRLPRPNSKGMRPLENRTTILQYYQAFKAFV